MSLLQEVNKFDSKEQMLEEYSKHCNRDEPEHHHLAAHDLAHCCVYVPHIYRGGYVIRGYGHSIERILNGYCTKDNCGFPELV